ncbi:7181_t:CDS:2 [Acaulospora colombiana]|uniref:7181_t:CDS:1 n=1 Tax=Acaulospora colombiana TaxID=27376 RepID=A0ACA9MK43_9GLOM|nr:7181_t:CDS:2 [Acaulospora colombiana]
MTVSLTSLPDELLLAIFEQLVPPNDGIPVTGTNAAWTPPSGVERRHSARSYLDEGFIEWFGDREDNEDNLLPVTIPESPFTRHSALWGLRQVNRRLNDLCIPFLFHDLNLLDNTLITEEAALVLPYVKHVRSIRLLVDPICFKLPEPEAVSAYQQSVSAIVQQCRNATSVALYYNNYTVQTEHFENELTNLMKQGKSRGLASQPPPKGNYHDARSNSILETAGYSDREDFFRCIHKSSRICLWPYLPANTTRSPNFAWTSLGILVTDVPKMVGHFQALQYLIVSTCGDDDDIVPPYRPSGWSHLPDALCKRRPPLEEFHIEHMLNWEIMAMGTIPTKKVIGSNLAKGHIAEVFETDPEIFPGLRIEKICEKRELKLTKDATRIKQGYTPL